jgi:hypothetical protein
MFGGRSLVAPLLLVFAIASSACDDRHDPSKWGYVDVSVGATPDMSSASAYFVKRPTSSSASSTTTSGNCTALVSYGSVVTSETGSGLATPGTVTLSSSRGSANLVPQDPAYPVLTFDPAVPIPAWQSGESLTVKSTGGEVPAFTATTTVPPATTFNLPLEGAVLDRGVDLEVPWSAVTTEQNAAVSLWASYSSSSPTAPGHTVYIGCHTSSADLKLVIPHGLLAKLEPMNEDGSAADISISGEFINETRVWAGDYLVVFQVLAGRAQRHVTVR